MILLALLFRHDVEQLYGASWLCTHGGQAIEV